LNCTAGVYCGTASLVNSTDGTSSGLSYGLQTDGGIIIKKGTQPTGSVANERVVSGQII
jgi:hypothetical protein